MSNSKAIAEAIIGNLDEFRTDVQTALSNKVLEALDEKKREIATGLFGGLNEARNVDDRGSDAREAYREKKKKERNSEREASFERIMARKEKPLHAPDDKNEWDVIKKMTTKKQYNKAVRSNKKG